MSIRKHGTGQVLPEDQEQPKTASAQQWDEEDEKALDEESKED
jgi:hypothetical protein